jgi:hypothetical protein
MPHHHHHYYLPTLALKDYYCILPTSVVAMFPMPDPKVAKSKIKLAVRVLNGWCFTRPYKRPVSIGD